LPFSNATCSATPREPAAALAAGVAALHYAMRPYNPEALRHAWVLRAAALLQHAGKLRALGGHPQEGDYNLARWGCTS
jgi:hypothetical protein